MCVYIYLHQAEDNLFVSPCGYIFTLQSNIKNHEKYYGHAKNVGNVFRYDKQIFFFPKNLLIKGEFLSKRIVSINRRILFYKDLYFFII